MVCERNATTAAEEKSLLCGGEAGELERDFAAAGGGGALTVHGLGGYRQGRFDTEAASTIKYNQRLDRALGKAGR